MLESGGGLLQAFLHGLESGIEEGMTPLGSPVAATGSFMAGADTAERSLVMTHVIVLLRTGAPDLYGDVRGSLAGTPPPRDPGSPGRPAG